MDKHNHKGGLIPPKKEYIGKRVFSYPKYFGAPIVVSVPDFQIGSPRVKNQGGDGTCTVFAATSVSEDQEGVELEPAYQWLKTAQLGGVYPQGAAPGDVCKSLTKFGSLSVAASPLHLPEAGASVVQIKQNWDKIDNLDSVAFMYRKRSYFELEGLGDRFDSIRQILWANKLGGVTAFVGLYWQPEWTYAQGGICAFFGNDRSLPHAIKIFGQKTINGVVYLMVQNSWGKEVGDQGIFYFSREVANKLLFAYAFFDVDPAEVKKETWSLLAKWKDWIIKTFFPAPVPPVIPTPPPLPPPEPPKPISQREENLQIFCEAIKTFEGWVEKPPSRSFLNNNPGNFKFTNYAESLGATEAIGGYAKFPSYQIGWEALAQLVRDAASDQLIGYHGCTISSFFATYAPTNDGNQPAIYASFVAKKLKVDVSEKLKNII